MQYAEGAYNLKQLAKDYNSVLNDKLGFEAVADGKGYRVSLKSLHFWVVEQAIARQCASGASVWKPHSLAQDGVYSRVAFAIRAREGRERQLRVQVAAYISRRVGFLHGAHLLERLEAWNHPADRLPARKEGVSRRRIDEVRAAAVAHDVVA